MFKTFLLSILLGSTPTDTTVKVDCRIDNRIMVGSGTIIKTDQTSFHVLTCAHCVESNVKIKIILKDDRSYPAIMIKSDKNRDMCLLESNHTIEIKPAEMADSEEYLVNTQIIISGYPKGRTYSQRNGFITKELGFNSKDKSIVHTILKGDATDGDSGGGIFRNGKMIGILWGGRNGEVYINRLNTIRDFLKK